MLVYSIEAAIKSSLFDRVYVSTEDEEIASISMGCGAAVHPRPVKLAGDLVSATDVCIDVYKNRLEDGDIYDVIVCLNDRYMKDRQFLPPIYRPNGSIKIGRVPALLQNKTFFGSRLIVYETPEERSVHVASQFDFGVAECLMHKREITCIPGEKV
jgi:CMP-N-acetylneuraminic acid synthetase